MTNEAPQAMRQILDTVYTPEGVEMWWVSPNTMLDGASPEDVWPHDDGRVTDVARMVAQHESGPDSWQWLGTDR